MGKQSSQQLSCATEHGRASSTGCFCHSGFLISKAGCSDRASTCPKCPTCFPRSRTKPVPLLGPEGWFYTLDGKPSHFPDISSSLPEAPGTIGPLGHPLAQAHLLCLGSTLSIWYPIPLENPAFGSPGRRLYSHWLSVTISLNTVEALLLLRYIELFELGGAAHH